MYGNLEPEFTLSRITSSIRSGFNIRRLTAIHVRSLGHVEIIGLPNVLDQAQSKFGKTESWRQKRRDGSGHTEADSSRR